MTNRLIEILGNPVVYLGSDDKKELYIDRYYRCWVRNPQKPDMLYPSKCVYIYCLHGYGEISGQGIMDSIPEAIEILNGDIPRE